MGDVSVIIEGIDTIDPNENRLALYSTIHGAGRIMSRSEAKGKRTKKGVVLKEGKIFRSDMEKWVRKKGVTLRGAGVDESPHCYKRLVDVLEAHKNTVRILHTLTPIGVAMAGENEYDPWKD